MEKEELLKSEEKKKEEEERLTKILKKQMEKIKERKKKEEKVTNTSKIYPDEPHSNQFLASKHEDISLKKIKSIDLLEKKDEIS